MNNEFNKHKQHSEYLSQKYVVPFLNKQLKIKYPNLNCFVGTVESLGESFANLLDMNAGVDLYYKNDSNIYFIAQRISERPCTNRFILRYRTALGGKTEFEKRISAMEHNAIRPTWNMHTYIDGNQLTIGIVNSDKLFKYLKQQNDNGSLYIGNDYDGSYYCGMSWNELNNYGIKVTVFKQYINEMESI